MSQGQGRGRGRGRGRGQGRGRRKGIGRSKAVADESSSSQSGSEGAADVVLEKGGSLKRKADGQLPQPRRVSTIPCLELLPSQFLRSVIVNCVGPSLYMSS